MSQILVTGEAKIRDIQGPVVANSGVITALDGAASQYVRGDGTLADFPTSSGGGSSVSYYLNSSVSQGTIGGVAYRELSKEPIIGAGTDIAISANGYVASYLTDANDPDVVIVPGGNFNCEFYFSVSNDTGNPTTYAELYKYNGTTFTLLGSSVGVPESINQGTIIAPYYFAIPVPSSPLALTDRLAIRIYVNVDGRTVTLHTENSHLCQVVTTLSKGMVSLNNLTDQSQYLTTGTSGTNFAIVSSGDTHTFNLPVASATNTGKLSSSDWSTFYEKVPYTGATASVNLGVYDLIASGIYGTFIEASVNGLASSPLVLRTGTTGFSAGTDSVSLISSPTSAHTLSIISNIASPNVTKRANIGLDLLSATRTFTLPDLSGTLALLESAQTFTGKKTFSNGVNITGDVILSGGTGYGGGIRYNQGIIQAYGSSETTTEFTDVNSIKYYVGQGSGNYKNFVFDVNNITLNATRTYSLPDATGTIALTSQLTSGTVTSVGLSSATSGVTIGSSPITTSGTITLAIATASGSQNGLLSSTDWTTFNNKQSALTNPVTGTGTTNYLPKFTGASTIGNSIVQDSGSVVTIGGALTITNANINLSNAYYLSARNNANTGYLSLIGRNTSDKVVIDPDGYGVNIGGAATFSSSVSAASGQFGSAFTTTTALSAFVPSATDRDMFQVGMIGVSNGFTLKRVSSVFQMEWAGNATFSGSVTANSFIKGIFNSTSIGGPNDHGFQFSNATTTTKSLVGGYDSVRGAYIQAVNFGTAYENLSLNPHGGNVGIGTSSPLLTAANRTTLDINGTNQSLLVLSNGGTYKGYLYNDGTNITLNAASALLFATTESERIRITSDGNVLVGTTISLNGSGTDATNGFRVTPNGTIVNNSTADANAYFAKRSGYSSSNFVDFYVAGTYVGAITTNGSATSYTTASDYRLKQDLKEYNGLDLISKIKTYDYQWKSDNTRSFGVIAHELQEIIPQAVNGEKDGEKMQGVDYSKIVPILVKAIQEQQAQIEELKALINK